MIEVESLRFRYPKQPSDTIRGIDFHVAQGEIFGFLGPSGSGKSATQKLLIGLQRV
jgi:fluoroquinolone transport system ATP-binding protein